MQGYFFIKDGRGVYSVQCEMLHRQCGRFQQRRRQQSAKEFQKLQQKVAFSQWTKYDRTHHTGCRVSWLRQRIRTRSDVVESTQFQSESESSLTASPSPKNINSSPTGLWSDLSTTTRAGSASNWQPYACMQEAGQGNYSYLTPPLAGNILTCFSPFVTCEQDNCKKLWADFHEIWEIGRLSTR